MEFGDKLAGMRKEKGLSQEQLADQLDVSRQAVSRWEAGNALPDVNNLKKISEVFEVSADYLLNDDLTKESGRTADPDNQKKGKKPYQVSFFLITCGAIGIGLLIILSSLIPAVKMVPGGIKNATKINLSSGEVYQGAGTGQASETDQVLYVQKKVYSFFPFLNHYHLKGIAAVFLVMAVGGVILYIYLRISRQSRPRFL